MADDSSSHAPPLSSAIPVSAGASTELVANGINATNVKQQAMVVTSASDIAKEGDGAQAVNHTSHRASAPTLPSVPPQTSTPKYSMYTEDDGDEERVDPVPVPDYRPINNFANGLDRPSKKRVRLCCILFYEAVRRFITLTFIALNHSRDPSGQTAQARMVRGQCSL